jgi:hypothetical protein
MSDSIEKKIETSTSFMERTIDGIVIVRKKLDSFVDLDAAKEDYKAHRALAGEKSPSMLVMNEMLNATDEAREFFSLPIHEEYRSAEAFVVTNLGIRLLVKFYMSTVKKSYPISIFSNEESAKEWLRKFV